MKTLGQTAPREFHLEYTDTPAYKLRDVEVVSTHEGDDNWPGPHRHVYVWWVLADGHRVGWNENPALGWSFPVLPKARQVKV